MHRHQCFSHLIPELRTIKNRVINFGLGNSRRFGALPGESPFPVTPSEIPSFYDSSSETAISSWGFEKTVKSLWGPLPPACIF